jgi:hypothetical protein
MAGSSAHYVPLDTHERPASQQRDSFFVVRE